MAEDYHLVAPAVRDSLALCELREYASRSPHMSFGVSMRRAIVDALERAARLAANGKNANVIGARLPDGGTKGASDV